MSLRTLIRPRAGHLGRSRADRLRRSRADRPRRPRAGHLRLLAAALSLFALGAGGWLWLRDSSLVRVEDVEITGVTASDGDHVRAALDEAGREQTTLHVRMDALRAAVRAYASVADLRVRADFPHTLRIEVIEHRPVAALVVGDSRVPVTGSGLLLTGVQADADLPDLRPARPAVGDRVDDPRARAALAVAGDAPPPLLHRAACLAWGPRGLFANMRDGPDLIFGSSQDAVAKWAAAARVLAEPSAQGALYLDLRIPGRVAAGGLEPVLEEDSDGSANDPSANPQPQGENSTTLNP